jgi:hypothetical protein
VVEDGHAHRDGAPRRSRLRRHIRVRLGPDDRRAASRVDREAIMEQLTAERRAAKAAAVLKTLLDGERIVRASPRALRSAG